MSLHVAHCLVQPHAAHVVLLNYQMNALFIMNIIVLQSTLGIALSYPDLNLLVTNEEIEQSGDS